MRRRLITAAAAMLLLLIRLCPDPAYAEDGTAPEVFASIPVQYLVTGGSAGREPELRLTLTGLEEETPMPAGSDHLSRTITVRTGEETDFGEIRYTKADVYHYRITRVPGDNADLNRDDSVYEVTVAALNDGTAEITIQKEGVDGKLETVLYRDTGKSQAWPATGDRRTVLPDVAAAAAAAGMLLILRERRKKMRNGRYKAGRSLITGLILLALCFSAENSTVFAALTEDCGDTMLQEDVIGQSDEAEPGQQARAVGSDSETAAGTQPDADGPGTQEECDPVVDSSAENMDGGYEMTEDLCGDTAQEGSETPENDPEKETDTEESVMETNGEETSPDLLQEEPEACPEVNYKAEGEGTVLVEKGVPEYYPDPGYSLAAITADQTAGPYEAGEEIPEREVQDLAFPDGTTVTYLFIPETGEEGAILCPAMESTGARFDGPAVESEGGGV